MAINVKETYIKNGKSKLLEKANTLPKTSGCYFMRGKNAEILYVGKAKNLRARVSSYFNNSAKTPKTEVLVGHICDFDFILTNSEVESLVLENNLIKEHRPKYNIMLRDDKTYPYVLLNMGQVFPRLEYVRRPKRKANLELYGPFPVGSSISKVMRTLTKAYKLRDCSDHEFKTRKTPCLLYQMDQCSAPCVGYISKEEYQNDLQQATNYFQGIRKAKTSLENLEKRMFKLADEEKFEQAAIVRDQVEELNEFISTSFNQNVESLNDHNIDIISYFVGDEEVDISIYLVRQGNLLGHKNFHFLRSDFLEEVEAEIQLAIVQYYQQNDEVLPEKVICTLNKKTSIELEEGLRSLFGEYIKLRILSNPKKYSALILATTNHAIETQQVRKKNQDSVYVGLNKLKDLLGMKERPKLLECYDIAVWQGKSPTASQIVFYEGKADKTQYRYYHLTERPEGNNDFAMMREVFSRRLERTPWPDVFIVDGGVQQVSTVKKVLVEFSCPVPVVGIAKARDLKKYGFKDKNVQHSDERLVIPGRSNPYILNKCMSLFRIVVQMRDEAHRFSRKLHHKTEKKRVIQTWIDEVKGLSSEIRIEFRHKNIFTKEELSLMNLSELQNFFGFALKHARAIYTYLHAEENN